MVERLPHCHIVLVDYKEMEKKKKNPLINECVNYICAFSFLNTF